jgi:hypothetical protein
LAHHGVTEELESLVIETALLIGIGGMGERLLEISGESSTPTAVSSVLGSKASGASSIPSGTLDVGDLAALVFHEQRGASRVLDHAGAVREAVDGLAVLYALDQGGHLSLPRRTTVTSVRT